MKNIALSRNKRMYGSLIICLILAGGSFTVWALQTNKGVVMATSGAAPVHAPAIVSLHGTYIDFNYSDSYKVATLPVNETDVESYNLTANTNYEKHLAVIVRHLDAAGLNGFTGFSSRNARSDIYDKQDRMVGQLSAIEFTKKDTTEKTIFIPHGDKVAVLSFVTTSHYDDIDSEITAVLHSFVWRQ